MLPFVLVVAGALVALAALDRLPGLLSGEPRGTWRLPTVAALERRTGVRVRLPAYFPATFRWPAASIRLATGSPPSAALVFDARATGRPALVVCETLGAPGAIAPVLLEPAAELQATPVTIDGRPGTLARLSLDEGGVVLEARWTSSDRTFAVRFAGPVDELLRIADSLERNGR